MLRIGRFMDGAAFLSGSSAPQSVMAGGEGVQKQANEETQAHNHTNHQGAGSSLPELLSGSRRSESGNHIGTLLVPDAQISYKSASDCEGAVAGLLKIDSSDTEDSCRDLSSIGAKFGPGKVEPSPQAASTESQSNLVRAATPLKEIIPSSGVQRYELDDSSDRQGATPLGTVQKNSQRSLSSEHSLYLKTPSNGQGGTCVKSHTFPRISDRSSIESDSAISPLTPVPFRINPTVTGLHLDPFFAGCLSIPVEVPSGSSGSTLEIISHFNSFPEVRLKEIIRNIFRGSETEAEVAGHQCGDDMATGFQRMSGDARRYPSSSFTRSENRPPMSNVPCRNGPLCRKFAEGETSTLLVHGMPDLHIAGTCGYNHDFGAVSANGLSVYVSWVTVGDLKCLTYAVQRNRSMSNRLLSRPLSYHKVAMLSPRRWASRRKQRRQQHLHREAQVHLCCSFLRV